MANVARHESPCSSAPLQVQAGTARDARCGVAATTRCTYRLCRLIVYLRPMIEQQLPMVATAHYPPTRADTPRPAWRLVCHAQHRTPPHPHGYPPGSHLTSVCARESHPPASRESTNPAHPRASERRTVITWMFGDDGKNTGRLNCTAKRILHGRCGVLPEVLASRRAAAALRASREAPRGTSTRLAFATCNDAKRKPHHQNTRAARQCGTSRVGTVRCYVGGTCRCRATASMRAKQTSARHMPCTSVRLKPNSFADIDDMWMGLKSLVANTRGMSV